MHGFILIWFVSFIVLFVLLIVLGRNEAVEALRLKPCKIPRVAHFVYGLWDKGDVPMEFKKNIERWRKQGWDIRMWNKEQALHLLAQYPRWESLYHAFPRNIQRADLIRYLIVYEHGGFYFDCDCRVKNQNLFRYVTLHAAEDEAIYFVEHNRTWHQQNRAARMFSIRKGELEPEQQWGNFAFGTVAQHFTLLKIMEKVEERFQDNPDRISDYDILYISGPDALTAALTPYQKDVKLLYHGHYMDHECTGTWRRKKDG